MAGMGANELIFNNLNPNGYEIKYLHWELPTEKESLKSYALRISTQIKHEKPILLGVSFGGVIVQEIAKMMDYEQIILISSVKKHSEFPPIMKWCKRLKLHKILPLEYFLQKKWWRHLPKGKPHHHLYEKFLTFSSPDYLRWAIDAILNWEQEHSLPRTIHIHGSKDFIFPAKYIENKIEIKNATHILIITRYRWLNANLPQLLNQNL